MYPGLAYQSNDGIKTFELRAEGGKPGCIRAWIRGTIAEKRIDEALWQVGLCKKRYSVWFWRWTWWFELG